MAAVPIGFERWEPGQPWGDVVHDDGTRTSVPDPDGSIEAEARSWGARYNAQPKAAPAAIPQPALTGAASPPLPPSTPSPDVPAAPPLPSGAPLTGAEKAPLQASPQEQQALQGPPGLPATGQSPAAQALADHGVDPSTLPKVGAPGAAPSPLSPALAAVQQHAPQLVAGKAEVKSEGPDAVSAANIRGGSDLALELKGKAIDQGSEAKALNTQGQAGVANQDYFDAFRAQQQAMGQMGALTKARDDAAAKLAQVKQAPIADHPDFPDWFVATSILGSIAGGFAEGFSGGRYKSSTLPMLQQIVGDWQNTQRYNKSNLISSLEEQLGDKNAALLAGGSRIKDELANMAEAKARFARTVEAQRELTATATGLRASALEDWTKAQAVVMGKVSEGITLAAPKGVGKYTNATLDKLKANGVDPKLWERALGEQIKDGRQNAPSVAQTASSVKQIDSDRALLQALSEANKGTLPTRGTINIPQALVPTLARLGYEPGMNAEQVGQILGGYVMGRARSYGGAVTESDAAAAEKETGKTTEGVMRYLDRLRNQSNHALSTELGRFFPGREQAMLDILLERSSEGVTPGVPQTASTPFDKHNHAADRNNLPGKAKVAARPIEEPLSADEEERRVRGLYGDGPIAPLSEPIKYDPSLEHTPAAEEDDLVGAYNKRGR
jgi:hypothetical protein